MAEAPLRCRLCGASPLVPRLVVHGCRVAHCRGCDFTQVVDRVPPAQVHSLYGPGYFNHEKYRDPFARRRENLRRLRLVQRFVHAPAACLLEAGCGVGDFIALARPTYVVSGVDLSADAVAEARRVNAPIAERIWCRDLGEIDLPPAHFDALCLWDVIEHLWDFGPVCARLMESLKPGGYLFLSTPDAGSWPARFLGRYWPLMTPPEHLSFFSARSLQRFVQVHLNSVLVYSAPRGKWVNARFALQKIGRVAPAQGAAQLFNHVRERIPAALALYLPSRDIRYAVARRPTGAGS